jgi:hypothetical protein
MNKALRNALSIVAQEHNKNTNIWIAQLVERSLSVMKDPGSNLGMDICSFYYWSVIELIVKLMSINGVSIYIDC